ncbi:MAG: addiction module protein [Spirochaetes bacterium]|nr:addiction module protein [Spirochaetota bacterium]MBN2770127.1 addiction module protein [Spirochaetota bacterium]
MTKATEKIALDIHSLPDIEKMYLVEVILADLDKPDPEIDRIWAEEARNRWAAHKAGRIPAVSYSDVMGKYRRI